MNIDIQLFPSFFWLRRVVKWLCAMYRILVWECFVDLSILKNIATEWIGMSVRSKTFGIDHKFWGRSSKMYEIHYIRNLQDPWVTLLLSVNWFWMLLWPNSIQNLNYFHSRRKSRTWPLFDNFFKNENVNYLDLVVLIWNFHFTLPRYPCFFIHLSCQVVYSQQIATNWIVVSSYKYNLWWYFFVKGNS